MAQEIIMTAFWNAIFTVIALFQEILYTVIFWVNTPFLKTLTFSLFMINAIQYFDVQHAKFSKILMQILYAVYCIFSFLLPYYQIEFNLLWYEWLMLVPFFLVAFLGTFLKFTEFGRRWLSYYMMHLYYTIIAVIACLLFPWMGIWYGVLIFSVISLIFSNVGGLWKADASL